MTTSPLRTPPIVDLAWLEANLDRVVLADVRSYNDGRDERVGYERSHLPGAVFIDLHRTLAATPSTGAGRHPLPDPDDFAAAMSDVGIGDDDTVIAYDDTAGAAAARLVWMLRATGHEAALLDGGLHVWDGALDRGHVERTPARFSPRPWPTDAIASLDEVAAPGAVLIDARSHARYLGDEEPLDPVAGHIPGAISLPFADNLDGVLFRDPAQLRERFARVVDAADPIVYCGSGVTACHDLLAMEAVGIRGRLFPGSWSQWIGDPSRPIALGDEP